MATKHTPAPWTADDQQIWTTGAVLAMTHWISGVIDTDEACANARLIAAAPDLLAAARRALNVLKATGESVRPGNALGVLDAAIQKATGA